MRSRRSTRVLRACVFAGVLSLASFELNAHAGPAATTSVADRAKARRLYQDGEAKLARGDVPAALDAFVQSAQTLPAADTLRQVALLRDTLGQVRAAAEAWEAFLRVCPASATKNADEAKARIAQLKQTPGHVVLRGSPASTRIVVDGESSFDGFPVELDLSPGVHLFQLTAEGYVPQDVHVEVRFGETSSPAVDMEPEDKPPPPPVLDLGRPEPVTLPPPAQEVAQTPQTSWAASHTGALVVSGLALGFFAAGAYFGIEALDAHAAFRSRPSSSEADRGERAGFHADLAFGAGVLLGAAGLALLTGDDTPKTASVQFTPFVNAAAAGLSAGGRF